MNRKTIKNKLDKLVGNWCRTVRSNGVCERCGSSGNNSRDIQWAHIKSRRYLSTRWSSDNCFCLDAKCHRWFTDNPDEFYKWIIKNHPEQYERLLKDFRTVSKMGVNEMVSLYEKLKKELT